MTNTIREHELIILSTERFEALFGELQKQKSTIEEENELEEVFLLEIQLINSYIQQLLENLAVIANNEPNVILVTNEIQELRKDDLTDLALMHLVDVLNKYSTVDITKVLKCITI